MFPGSKALTSYLFSKSGTQNKKKLKIKRFPQRRSRGKGRERGPGSKESRTPVPLVTYERVFSSGCPLLVDSKQQAGAMKNS